MFKKLKKNNLEELKQELNYNYHEVLLEKLCEELHTNPVTVSCDDV